MTRQQKLMTVTVVFFLLSVLYAWFATPRLRKAPPIARPEQSTAENLSGLGEGTGSEGRLLVELLTESQSDFPGVRRNLFSSAAPVRPTPPPPKAPPVAKPVPPPLPEPPRVEKPPVAEVIRTSLARFTFLGYLEKQLEKSIFLTEDGTIFIVKEGERFGENERFAVRSITEDKMLIEDIDTATRIDVSLVEQTPLSPTQSGRVDAAAPAFHSLPAPDSDVDAVGEPPAPEEDMLLTTPEEQSESDTLPDSVAPPAWHNFPRGIPHD